MGQPKIYDVKTGAAKNYQKLISDDKSYFYWNGKHFSNNDMGDHIFVVNRHNKEALFTQIEKKVYGMMFPFPGLLNISQSLSSPLEPNDTLPVPIPPRRKLASVALPG